MNEKSDKGNIFNFITGFQDSSSSLDIITGKLPTISLRQQLDKVEGVNRELIKKLTLHLLEYFKFVVENQNSDHPRLLRNKVRTNDIFICPKTGALILDTKSILIDPLMNAKNIVGSIEDDLINFGMLVAEVL